MVAYTGSLGNMTLDELSSSLTVLGGLRFVNRLIRRKPSGVTQEIGEAPGDSPPSASVRQKGEPLT